MQPGRDPDSAAAGAGVGRDVEFVRLWRPQRLAFTGSDRVGKGSIGACVPGRELLTPAHPAHRSFANGWGEPVRRATEWRKACPLQAGPATALYSRRERRTGFDP